MVNGWSTASALDCGQPAMLAFCLLQAAFAATAVRAFGAPPFVASLDAQQQLGLGNPAPILNPEVDAAIERILADFRTPGGVSVAVLFDVLATGLLIANASLAPRLSWESKLKEVFPGEVWGLQDKFAEGGEHNRGYYEPPLGDAEARSGCAPGERTRIRRLRYLKPSTGFREHWQYNNHMYTVLSYLPPLLTGVPYETYVEDNIFTPLGMNATTFYSTVAEASGELSEGMTREGANATVDDPYALGTPHALPFWLPNDKPGHILSGAGAIVSSAIDMATWLQTLLEDGKHPETGAEVIPADAIRRAASGVMVMTGVASFPDLSPIVYGGAQMRGSYRGFEYIEHGGATIGHRTQITRVPSQMLGVAVLSNDNEYGSQLMEAVKFRIIDEALGLEPVDWAGRYRNATVKALAAGPPPSTPRRPDASEPMLPVVELEGTYTDAGRCRDAIKDAPRRLPDVLDPDADAPTLLALWPMIFGYSHVKLEHFEGGVFNLTVLASFKNLDRATNTTRPFWASPLVAPGVRAEFAYHPRTGKVGFGVEGGFWGEGAGVPPPSEEGKDVVERAEVWFERV
ncbi:Beta-lactamase class penicillin binding protein [Mycena kentingensis (nom. inval.)]|nr:Beta-lactamase class penicillin binding protein [Mycena kentingensis (nom. inval.)]